MARENILCPGVTVNNSTTTDPDLVDAEPELGAAVGERGAALLEHLGVGGQGALLRRQPRLQLPHVRQAVRLTRLGTAFILLLLPLFPPLWFGVLNQMGLGFDILTG